MKEKINNLAEADLMEIIIKNNPSDLGKGAGRMAAQMIRCLLYTSDAADE